MHFFQGLFMSKHLHRRTMASVVGLALTGLALASLGAAPVSADSIQVQSYQRADSDAACQAQADETPWQASWGPDASWDPSWELWANGGLGGPVCTRVITWARTPVVGAASSNGGGGGGGTGVCSVASACVLGDIGPGGGLVFYIGGGVAYEMAPNTWGAAETGILWCNVSTSVATNSAIGTGAANTTSMLTSAAPFVACTSGIANAARAYSGGGLTDWYAPSVDELNAMCNYSRTWAGAPPTGGCSGPQDPTFAGGPYGFTAYAYWSSSQSSSPSYTGYADFLNPGPGPFPNRGIKSNALVKFRPIRSF